MKCVDINKKCKYRTKEKRRISKIRENGSIFNGIVDILECNSLDKYGACMQKKYGDDDFFGEGGDK